MVYLNKNILTTILLSVGMVSTYFLGTYLGIDKLEAFRVTATMPIAYLFVSKTDVIQRKEDLKGIKINNYDKFLISISGVIIILSFVLEKIYLK